MPNKHPEIFISYSWHDKGLNVADDLERCLQEKGFAVIRDNRAIGYKGLIKEYMQRLGRGKCIILVLSDQYFKSPNCMYELLQIAQYSDFQKRIFPVIVDGAAFYRPEDRLKYITYWDEEKTRLQEEIRKIPNLANLHGITDDLDLYDDIRRNIARLLDFLRNLNTYPLQGGNYEPLLEAIQANLPTPELDYSRLPIDFSSTIEFLTQYFVGRQDAMARIDEFIQTHSSGYLAIVGEAGIGKSALLAKLVKERGYPHHFVDDKQNSAKDEVFLRSIVGQLQQQYGFEFEERTPLSVSEWNIYFQKWLKEISTEEQLVICVDALDEAQHYGDRDNLLKYLPQNLPENVYFILSSRPEFKKEDITFFDSTVFERCDLPPFTQTDIEDYLAVRSSRLSNPLPGGAGVGHLAEASTTSQVAAVLYHKSEGNPLYLHYLLQEYDSENLTLEQVNQLPQGLTKFYEKQWRERIWIGDKSAKEGRKQILCLLLILKQPPNEDMLLALTDFDRAELQDYLTPLRRFMRVGEQYAIFHDSFKEFLQIKFHNTIESWHKNLIHYLLDWQQLENVSLKKYALSWLPLHLAEINDDEKLFHLIETSTFLKVQEEFLSEKPLLSLWTLQIALQSAAAKDDATRMTKFLLLHAQRTANMLQESPVDALQKENIERAWRLADQHTTELRTKWHLLFIWISMVQNQKHEIHETIHHLQQKVPSKLSLDQEMIWLLTQLYPIGQEHFFSLCQTILQKPDEYTRLCNAFIEEGQFDAAVNVASRLEYAWKETFFLCEIAKAQIQAKEISKAQKTLHHALAMKGFHLVLTPTEVQKNFDENAPNLQYKVIRYRDSLFSSMKSRPGRTDYAINEDGEMRLTEIIIGLVRTGNMAMACTLLQYFKYRNEMLYSHPFDHAWITVAEAQALAGQQEEAQQIFYKVLTTNKYRLNYDYPPHLGYDTIFATMVRSLGVEATFEIRRQIGLNEKELREFPKFAREIALAYVRQRNDRAALSIIESLTNKYQLITYCDIAEAQAHIGNMDIVGETIQRAFKVVPNIQPDEFSDLYFFSDAIFTWAISRIATTQVRIGDVTAAIQTAKKLLISQYDFENYTCALSEITSECIRIGKKESAFDWMIDVMEREIVDKRRKDYAYWKPSEFDQMQLQNGREQILSKIVKTQLKMKQIQEAEETVKKSKGKHDNLLYTIAVAQMQNREISDVFETARQIERQWLPVRLSLDEKHAMLENALEMIAVTQAVSGRLKDAVKIVAYMQNYQQQFNSLRIIADKFIQTGEFQKAKFFLKSARIIAKKMRRRDLLREIQTTFDRIKENIQECSIEQISDEQFASRSEIVQQLKAQLSQEEKNSDSENINMIDYGASREKAKNIKQLAKALSLLAMEQYQAAQKQQAEPTLEKALKTLLDLEEFWQKIEEVCEQICEIACLYIKIGLAEKAFQIVKQHLENQYKYLLKLAATFVEVGDSDNFKRLLIPCALFLDAAYEMCGHLARLYPEQATAIAEILLQQEHLDKKHYV